MLSYLLVSMLGQYSVWFGKIVICSSHANKAFLSFVLTLRETDSERHRHHSDCSGVRLNERSIPFSSSGLFRWKNELHFTEINGDCYFVPQQTFSSKRKFHFCAADPLRLSMFDTLLDCLKKLHFLCGSKVLPKGMTAKEGGHGEMTKSFSPLTLHWF